TGKFAHGASNLAPERWSVKFRRCFSCGAHARWPRLSPFTFPGGVVSKRHSRARVEVAGTVGHSIDQVWAAVIERVRDRIGAAEIRRLIDPLRIVSLTDREVRIEAPNKLALVCAIDSVLPTLREAVAGAIGPRHVVLTLAARQQGELFPDLVRPSAGDVSPAASAGLNPQSTFATFVGRASNQFSHAAARAVASKTGDHSNPLFVYGGVGLGKTHLLQAVGHELLRRQPLARVLYLSCDAFMNELITALRRDRVGDFKERLR